MKKFIAFIIFLTFCFLLASLCGRSGLPASIKADYNQSLSTYKSNYEKYRSINQQYLKTKNAYLTYKTLASQTEAINAAKLFLTARDDLLISYYTLLKDKIDLTEGIFPFDKMIQKDVISSRLVELAEHQQTIPAVFSLEDIVAKSKEIDTKSADYQTETQKFYGMIITGKVVEKLATASDLSQNLSALVSGIKDSKKDVSKLERWLLEVNNKENLVQQKINAAQDLFNNLPVKDEIQRKEDLKNAKENTQNANQYLKEAVFYISEIITELKTGPY